MIKYKQGDLLQAFENREIDTFIIQENCTVGMGAGISKSVINKYPEIRKYNLEQLKIAKIAPKDVLGLLVPYMLNDKRFIYGVYSQYFPGSPRTEFDTFEQRINWLEKGFDTFNRTNYNNIKLGLPLISSGLAACKVKKAGLTDLDYFKKYIAPIVKKYLNDVDVTIYYL